jgi:epoxyqueuosine reductase
MEKAEIIKMGIDLVRNSEDNVISAKTALSKDLVGMKIYEEPIFSFGAADDDEFALLKKPEVMGSYALTPLEWLPSAKTVISFFLPFTETVRRSNTRNMHWPSDEWLHGRVEGQAFLFKLCEHINSALIKAGYESVVPSLDKRFWSKGSTAVQEKDQVFTSNWSERHAAYICGLGTFGLSKGLITKKGVAGRFGSIITSLYLSPDQREYRDIYEYCSQCGQCAENCPAQAISLEEGKHHLPCAQFINNTREKCQPRFGCGKCQVGVPCESGIPGQLGVSL